MQSSCWPTHPARLHRQPCCLYDSGSFFANLRGDVSAQHEQFLALSNGIALHVGVQCIHLLHRVAEEVSDDYTEDGERYQPAHIQKVNGKTDCYYMPIRKLRFGADASEAGRALAKPNEQLVLAKVHAVLKAPEAAQAV